MTNKTGICFQIFVVFLENLNFTVYFCYFPAQNNTVLTFHITKDKWLLKTSANLWDVLNLGNEAKNWKIISLFFHQIELKTLPLQSVNPCCVLHVKSNQKKRGFVKNTMGPDILWSHTRILIILFSISRDTSRTIRTICINGLRKKI